VIGFGAFDALTIDRSVAVIGRVLRSVTPTGVIYQRAGENR
jgi:hypothetical protein